MRSLLLILLLIIVPLTVNAQDDTSARQARKISLLHAGVPSLIGSAALLMPNDYINLAGGFLLSYGLIVGPSMGNFTQKEWIKGSLGMGIRLLGAGTGFYGILTLFVDYKKGLIIFWSGVMISAGGILWNIIDVKDNSRNLTNPASNFQFMLPAFSIRF